MAARPLAPSCSAPLHSSDPPFPTVLLSPQYAAWLSRGDVGGDAASEGPSEVSLEEDEEVAPTELDMPPPCWRCSEVCCEAYGVPARVFHGEAGREEESLRAGGAQGQLAER